MPVALPLAAAAMLVLSTAPSAEDVDAAEAAYQVAMSAMADERYEEAAEAFHRAWDHVSDPVLLWNSGRAWEKAGRFEAARDRYKAFLASEEIAKAHRLKASDAVVRVELAIRERAEGHGPSAAQTRDQSDDLYEPPRIFYARHVDDSDKVERREEVGTYISGFEVGAELGIRDSSESEGSVDGLRFLAARFAVREWSTSWMGIWGEVGLGGASLEVAAEQDSVVPTSLCATAPDHPDCQIGGTEEVTKLWLHLMEWVRVPLSPGDERWAVDLGAGFFLAGERDSGVMLRARADLWLLTLGSQLAFGRESGQSLGFDAGVRFTF